MAEEKVCFIIMPISTPEAVRSKYRDGADHFRHVLQCLLIPSVERAGFKALPPIAEGSDLIHAEIVKHLESADLVLCDMSSLNPNVFFEFGIRSALNKPVCVVKDDVTEKVPFDTGILNHAEYKSALEAWELEGEITKIAKHVGTSFDRSKGTNTLWRYFGAKTEAVPVKGEKGSDEKLDLLFMQMDALRQELISANRDDRTFDDPGGREDRFDKAAIYLMHLLGEQNIGVVDIRRIGESTLAVKCEPLPERDFAVRTKRRLRMQFGFEILFGDMKSHGSTRDDLPPTRDWQRLEGLEGKGK